ncbi:MAG: hypothetical protein LBQ31_00040 [Bacteroidales bacterium]|jgi:hypothetical protein|nr:hypothetical protein [Bacteroidales bacterium]
MKKILFIGLTSIMVLACREEKKAGDTDEYKNKWINSCAMVVADSAGVDRALAQEKCACMYDVLYSIDSLYFNIENGYEASMFIYRHYKEIDSLCDVSKFKAEIKTSHTH